MLQTFSGANKMNKAELFLGDCLEYMKTISDNSIDLILTDPPYNIGDKNKRTKVGNNIISNEEAWGSWDQYSWEDYENMMFELIKQSLRILRDGGSFYCFTAREYNGYFTKKAIDLGFNYNNTLAILKDNPLPHFTKTNFRSCFELCFYVSKSKPKTFNFVSQKICKNVFNYLIGRKETTHPTEKPLLFCENIIKISSNENNIIFDPFMGSGTTGVASLKLQRKFIGCEINKEYFEIAKKRIGHWENQTRLGI
ncbi:MAG: hypothetical protein CL528_13315 [Aequorivita sp.]|jgi:DNA modification methylase|nr:hypothetical protein [Aequorivita sp.]|tara:strand:- start:685 stop:1443 length:759 start_codon:yes stop_codon:yes gene_type:complete